MIEKIPFVLRLSKHEVPFFSSPLDAKAERRSLCLAYERSEIWRSIGCWMRTRMSASR